ncbi:MAG: prephenate dehydrogenase/arogenate dehydrogenase family protein [Acidimicrobiales bacterium]|nr:prephenate dehydrogenase/arogenate dehydrogenase family protein [Acidimicrobiales bacterium]
MSGAAPQPERRAWVIGCGLIGGSLASGLTQRGWHVSVTDSDDSTVRIALDKGYAQEARPDPDASIVFCATPVGVIPAIAAEALAVCAGVVTDVGSTKGQVVEAVTHERFVGGHPMAGSEQDGIAGADPDLFVGATWVLTPRPDTEARIFSTVRGVVRSLGAEVLTMPARTHDEMVAQVSHVPHLTAAALMNLADESSVEHRALLRLAAGGFRDMTRISAGRPSIWPDIISSNTTSIAAGLDSLIDRLTAIRAAVKDGRSDELLATLERARIARINLPTGITPSDRLVEFAIPIPDRPGEIAAIATLATELDVNIHDIELTHSGEGRRGVMLLFTDESARDLLVGGLIAKGYRPTVRSLD